MKDNNQEILVYLCPNCNFARSELEIRMNKLTTKTEGIYYTYCPRCKTEEPLYNYRTKLL